jgi:hypothetical protein
VSNYPPGFSNRIVEIEFHNECELGHAWTALGYSELGGAFYANEDVGPFCPECGLPSADDREYDGAAECVRCQHSAHAGRTCHTYSPRVSDPNRYDICECSA